MSVTDHIHSLTAPEFIVVLVSGILYGIGAVLLFDKSKRHKFFLPYFYLGASGLLMAVAKVFDIVWDKSEGIKSDYPLHASLILETIGSTFMILALFRLLQVWQQVGLRGGGSGTRVLSLLAPITTFLVMVICIAGDIFLIKQDLVEEDGGEEDVEKTHTALLIKFVGALLFVVLTLVYMGLVMYLAHATKRCGTGIAAAASSAATTYLSNVRSNPSLLIPVLATLGILTLIRFSYYMALVGNMAFSQDDLDDEETLSWPLYVGLIVVPEIGAIIVAFLYDLTQVKNGVEQLQQGFTSLDREIA